MAIDFQWWVEKGVTALVGSFVTLGTLYTTRWGQKLTARTADADRDQKYATLYGDAVKNLETSSVAHSAELRALYKEFTDYRKSAEERSDEMNKRVMENARKTQECEADRRHLHNSFEQIKIRYERMTGTAYVAHIDP